MSKEVHPQQPTQQPTQQPSQQPTQQPTPTPPEGRGLDTLSADVRQQSNHLPSLREGAGVGYLDTLSADVRQQSNHLPSPREGSGVGYLPSPREGSGAGSSLITPMMDTKQISISDYDYQLPDERIAKFPVTPRDHSRLLVYDQGRIADDHFFNLADHIAPGSLMVFNNTRVIRARMRFHKATGALIEVFLLEPHQPADYEQMFLTRGRCTWLCMVGNLKKWKEGSLEMAITHHASLVTTVTATRLGEVGTSQIVQFEWTTDHSSLNTPVTFAELLEAAGQLPIPPYLNRETQQSDLTTYQTVYSKIKGSVAAPTAGLHFTPEVLSALDARGIDRQELTLHVGAGTFKPVKSQHMGGHAMHTEPVAVRRQTLQKLLDHDCQAIAVGTTSVRTLESLYYMGLKVMAYPQATEQQLHVGQWEPYELPATTMNPSRQHVSDALQALADWLDSRHLSALHATTQIIIAPGYHFKIVRRLITNFHQPQSTLLLLVSAFTRGRWRQIYDHALSHDYRFLSYGDSSLLSPPEEEGQYM